MPTRNPVFPPLFTGHAVIDDRGPGQAALSAVLAGEAGAGDVFWQHSDDVASAAFVLEPECNLDQALQMLPVLMVAIGDALGAIGPPKMPFTYRWPNVLVANGGDVGHAFALASMEAKLDAEPEFLIAGFTLRMRLSGALADAPGDAPDQTALHMEGAGDLDSIDILESASRHFLAWIDGWMDDGFAKAHASYEGRIDADKPLADGASGVFVGLDEHGGALVKADGATRLLALSTALPAARPVPA